MPEVLKKVVTQRVKDGGFGNTSDYIRHLVRKDAQLAKAQKEFKDFVQVGMDDLRNDNVFSIEDVFSSLK